MALLALAVVFGSLLTGISALATRPATGTRRVKLMGLLLVEIAAMSALTIDAARDRRNACGPPDEVGACINFTPPVEFAIGLIAVGLVVVLVRELVINMDANLPTVESGAPSHEPSDRPGTSQRTQTGDSTREGERPDRSK